MQFEQVVSLFSVFISDLNKGSSVVLLNSLGCSRRRKTRGQADSKSRSSQRDLKVILIKSFNLFKAGEANCQERPRIEEDFPGQSQEVEVISKAGISNMALVAKLGKEIKDPKFTKIIQQYLAQMSGGRQGRKNPEVYFSYFKRIHKMKKNEEESLKSASDRKSFDERLKGSGKSFGNNCLHIKASFFVWRTLK